MKSSVIPSVFKTAWSTNTTKHSKLEYSQSECFFVKKVEIGIVSVTPSL